MADAGNEDNNVDVYLAGGSIEEGDISDPDYIMLLSDNTKFYYQKSKDTKYTTKSLKVIIRKFCKNKAVVTNDNIKYCEDCHKKISGAPKLTCLKVCLENIDESINE
jgi:hypothetical protein